MADNDTQWTWNFTGPTTMSKAQSRPSTPREIAWDLTGFDGNATGCLRTHPGFKGVTPDASYRFTPTGSTLVDFFPVTIIYNASTYFVGFVTASQTGNTTYFEFFLSSNGSSLTKIDISSAPVHTITAPDATPLEVDVQCSGRYVYLFVRGYPAQVVYVASSTPTLTKVAAGPGLVPTVETQLDTGTTKVPSEPCGVASATIGVAGVGYISPPVLSFAAPTMPGRTAQGYAVISGGAVTSIVITDQGSGYDNTTPPGITFTGGGYSTIATATAVLNPGTATASTTGRLAVMVDKRGNTGKTLYKSGSYGFAVQFLDSTTGRKSQISEIAYLDVPKNGTSDQTLPIMVRVWFPSTYTGGAWARGVYDKALIYRTVNQGTGGTLYGSGPLHLDSIITAPASTATVSPDGNNLRVTDTQLVYQDTFAGRTRSDNVPPQGGVAQFLGSTLFVSRILGNTAATNTDSVTGVTPPNPPPGIGDLRWSTTLDVQPENFSQFSRWVPQTPGNEIIAMRRVGMSMLGFSTDRMYKISRADSFIKVEEMHVGYGVAGKDALEAIGTMTYLVSGAGLKAVSADGQLEDVTSLDSLLNDVWLSNKSALKMAFDANGQCLTILNPATNSASGSAVCMWFGTNRITMLEDLPFRFVKSGNWIVGGQNQRRALFVKRTGSSEYGVYIVDHERTRGTGKNLCGGTAQFVYRATNTTVGVSADTWDCVVYGMPLLSFNGASYDTETEPAGQGLRSIMLNPVRWLIRENNGGAYTTGLGSGNYWFAEAPITHRWGGGNIGFQLQPDQPEFKDFFRQKQVLGARAYLEIVNLSYTNDPYGGTNVDFGAPITWYGEIYDGTSSTPLARAAPMDQNGKFISSLINDVGHGDHTKNNMLVAPFGRHGVMNASLSPGFWCITPGIDLKLLAFSLTGRILDTQRRRV